MTETSAESDNSSECILLTPAEVRILAVLAEKEALTPDNYPLSLNALVSGCNQLSSRDPVMLLSEEDVRLALDALVQKRLAAEVSQAGARVMKYEHRMRIQWSLPQDKMVILALLMLRGPQTAGEIRGRSGRMHEFGSIETVEAGLQFLIDKFPPMTIRLPREPGTKEARYTHTFYGVSAAEYSGSTEGVSSAIHPAAASRADRLEKLEQEVASLRSEMEQLKRELAQFRTQFE